MTDRVPRLLTSWSQVEDASFQVMEWGYYRNLVPADMNGHWIRYGEDVIWWFQYPEDVDWKPSTAAWHLAIQPSSQGGVYARSLFEHVRISACLLGLERLYVCNPADVVANYLERMGLARDEIGFYWDTREVKRGGRDRRNRREQHEEEPSEASSGA